jgi:holo-[acyl-carrier protein] synthase
MIIGVGIDAVLVPRLDRWTSNPALLDRFFHPQEIAASKERGKGMTRSLAVRFAAKEAFGKALGTGLAGIVLKDIMVANRMDEKPEMGLFGTALEAFRVRGAEKIHLSLTHEGEMAIAMVILEA